MDFFHYDVRHPKAFNLKWYESRGPQFAARDLSRRLKPD